MSLGILPPNCERVMQERIEQATREHNGEASGQGGDLKNRLIDLIDELRAQEAHSHDPRAQELLEVSAEVLGGLVKSFDDYQRQNHSVDSQTTAPTDAAQNVSVEPAGQSQAGGSAPQAIPITLTVNGVERTLTVAPWTTLLDLLRERLDLTGTKKGCDHGQCGACTVLVDGKRINSCLTLAVMKDGAQIVTIEGLARGEELHPMQKAFIEMDAFQCGYCTPGQICSAVGLLQEGHARSADDIRELMSGNICRCGAYPNIVAAIEQVMRAKRGKAPA
jgi:xanthine dehydrogenase YagT iron-sulfur-binding subunit